MPSDSLQNILNFRDVAQTINEIQGNDRLRQGRIYRSALPVRTVPSTYIFFLPKSESQYMSFDGKRLWSLFTPVLKVSPCLEEVTLNEMSIGQCLQIGPGSADLKIPH